MDSYELRIIGRKDSNIKWYLQKLVDNVESTRYPTSDSSPPYITASSKANDESSYSDIYTDWVNEGGISTDLSGYMTIVGPVPLTIKVVNENIGDVFHTNNIESIIVYYSTGKKKRMSTKVGVQVRHLL